MSEQYFEELPTPASRSTFLHTTCLQLTFHAQTLWLSTIMIPRAIQMFCH